MFQFTTDRQRRIKLLFGNIDTKDRFRHEATTELSSSLLSTAEMVLRLECAFKDMDRVEFTVNCDTYAYEKGAGFFEVHVEEADDEG